MQPPMNTLIPFLGFTTTPLELTGFVLSVITVLLNIRQTHWAWLFSIISSATYCVVFYHSKLFGDSGLQLVFIAVSVWGWYQWLYGGARHDALAVSWLGKAGAGLAAIGWLAGFGLLAWFLKTYTSTDVPLSDGFLTAGSLVGQLLLSRKKVENWIVWIVVDVLYVGLYLYKGLTLTAILYASFVVLAAIGLQAWRRAAAKAA
jgi:nicotinamide mononucleotide transporter